MGWETLSEKIVDLITLAAFRRKATDAFKDSVKMGQVARSVVEGGIGVDCFFLVMAHNSGGRLSPHKQQYVSLIDGDFNRVLMPKFDVNVYQNFIVDHEINQLLLNIFEYKEFGLYARDISHDPLKSIYISERIKFTKFFFIRQSKKSFWFLVLGTTGDGEDFGAAYQKVKIAFAVNDMKNIINKY